MNQEARILLVDDEQSVLNALQRFFRRSGYEGVVTCTSGREGLALFETSGPFQLVISDYRMPEMNGVEFLSAVRVRWPDTVRIVLSGFADTSAIIAATNEGNIYKFIPKPWDEDFLLQSVHEALEIHARNRERSEQMQMLTQALGAREEVVQGVLDLLPNRICAVNSEGRITIANRAWKEFARRAPENSGTAFSDAILSVCPQSSKACSPNDSLLVQSIKDVLEGRKTEFYFECACSVADTETHWFEVRGVALNGQDGVNVLVLHQDITNRVRREQQALEPAIAAATGGQLQSEQPLSKESIDFLQKIKTSLDALGTLQSQNLFRHTQVLSIYHALLDQMPVGLIGIDHEGEIVSMNNLARQILDLEGTPLAESAAAVLPEKMQALLLDTAEITEPVPLKLDGKQLLVLKKRLHQGEMDGVMLILIQMEGSACS